MIHIPDVKEIAGMQACPASRILAHVTGTARESGASAG
jgi:hypothetical protein